MKPAAIPKLTASLNFYIIAYFGMSANSAPFYIHYNYLYLYLYEFQSQNPFRF